MSGPGLEVKDATVSELSQVLLYSTKSKNPMVTILSGPLQENFLDPLLLPMISSEKLI